VTNLIAELTDGVVLARLLESLSAEKEGGGSRVQLKMQEAREVGSTAVSLDNLTLCFEAMAELGVNTKGVIAKDVMEGHTKHIVILVKNLMQWLGDEAALKGVSTTQTTGAGKNARERWASQVRSIEETRRLQIEKAKETRQRLLAGMAKTLQSKKASWDETALKKTVAGRTDVLKAKELIQARVAQAPPVLYSEPVEDPKEEDMWDVVDGGEDDEFTFTAEAPPKEELTEGEQAVRTLVQDMADATRVREACVTLGVMVRDRGELAVEVLLDGGGLVAIIDAMSFHDRDAKVQLDGCGAIANMAYYHPECGAALCGAGAARAVVDALNRHMNDLDVVSYTAGVLWNLSNGGQEASETVTSDGAVPSLIQAMGKYLEADQVLENASGALRNLSFVPSAQSSLVESGGVPQPTALSHALLTPTHRTVTRTVNPNPAGVPVILEVLRLQAGAGGAPAGELNTALAGDLSSVLENVGAGEAAYRDATLMESALKLLVAVLGKGCEDEGIASGAIGALWGLVCRAGAGEAGSCGTREVLAVGTCDAICAGLSCHLSSAEVQAKGCSVLACLANTDALEEEGEHPACTAIVDAGGLECLAGAVESLSEDADALLEVVSLLGLLGFEVGESHPRLIQSGGVTKLLQASRKHLDHAQLAAETCAALEGVADGDTKSCTALVEHGAVGFLIAAMKHHAGNEQVAANACGALWNLAFGSKHSAEVMVNEGAVQAILACMRVHAASPTIQTKACGALWNTANACTMACDVIIRAGGSKDITAAMENHASDAYVIENATGIMQHLQMR